MFKEPHISAYFIDFFYGIVMWQTHVTISSPLQARNHANQGFYLDICLGRTPFSHPQNPKPFET
jgi:hypothetical protein